MIHDELYPEPPDRVHEGQEALERIAELAVEPEWVTQAALRGFLAYRDTTHPHFPSTVAPFNEWGFTNKFFRDFTVPNGWTYRTEGGVPITIAPGNAFAVTATSGNEYTGLANRTPSTKHPRGTVSEGLIVQNSQYDLFSGPDEVPRIVYTGRRTWYLLYYPFRTEDGWRVRAELSLPRAVDEDKYIVAWYERIILPAIGLDSGPSNRRANDQNPTSPADIDFRVQRKGA